MIIPLILSFLLAVFFFEVGEGGLALGCLGFICLWVMVNSIAYELETIKKMIKEK